MDAMILHDTEIAYSVRVRNGNPCELATNLWSAAHGRCYIATMRQRPLIGACARTSPIPSAHLSLYLEVHVAYRTITSLLFAVLIAGCASSGSSGSRDRNLITAEEIADSRASSTYDLVRSLRPHFLRTNAPMSLNPGSGDVNDVVVYVDGTRMGDTGTLREVPTQDVSSIQFLSSSQATSRYGTGHPYGAIMVVTHGGRR